MVWPLTEAPLVLLLLSKVRPLGSVSLTVKPPVLSEGPRLVTVSV
jgi:hypothetical protein